MILFKLFNLESQEICIKHERGNNKVAARDYEESPEKLKNKHFNY